MGLISGYPVGAKVAANLRDKDICSKEECERLLSFTNNSGPLFITGTVGITMFGSTEIGLLLFITHLLASLTVGILFRFWKRKKNDYQTKNNTYKTTEKNNLVSLVNLGEVMAESIISSIKTILLIGGFIILFSSIISIINSSGLLNVITSTLSTIFNALNIDTSFIQGIFTGLLEVTNGLSLISNIHVKKLSINILIASFLLGFGGLSVMLQVLSIISKTDLSCKPYIIGKILQAFLATFYTYILMNVVPFLQFDL
ncbi:MAG: sporulation integral membrane protein YlbJ [Clostridia bacterium]|nr:sporulation integral membrane protein YlbJ [Clostridia bacterium]